MGIHIRGVTSRISACKKVKTMPTNTNNHTHKPPVNDENVSTNFVNIFVVPCKGISHYKAVLLGLRGGGVLLPSHVLLLGGGCFSTQRTPTGSTSAQLSSLSYIFSVTALYYDIHNVHSKWISVYLYYV